MNTTVEQMSSDDLLSPTVIGIGEEALKDESRDFTGTVGDVTVANPGMTTRNVNVYFSRSDPDG